MKAGLVTRTQKLTVKGDCLVSYHTRDPAGVPETVASATRGRSQDVCKGDRFTAQGERSGVGPV